MTDQAPEPAVIDSVERPSIWMAVLDAAKATGWSPAHLHSLAKRGTITCRRSERGLEILIEDGQPHPDASPAMVADGIDGAADQRDHVRWLETTVEAQRSELAAAQRDLATLRVELARAEERLRAVEAVARSDVAAAQRIVEAELAAKDEIVAELRGQVVREIGRGDALAASLADARLPWWRRVLR